MMYSPRNSAIPVSRNPVSPRLVSRPAASSPSGLNSPRRASAKPDTYCTQYKARSGCTTSKPPSVEPTTAANRKQRKDTYEGDGLVGTCSGSSGGGLQGAKGRDDGSRTAAANQRQDPIHVDGVATSTSSPNRTMVTSSTRKPFGGGSKTSEAKAPMKFNAQVKQKVGLTSEGSASPRLPPSPRSGQCDGRRYLLSENCLPLPEIYDGVDLKLNTPRAWIKVGGTGELDFQQIGSSASYTLILNHIDEKLDKQEYENPDIKSLKSPSKKHDSERSGSKTTSAEASSRSSGKTLKSGSMRTNHEDDRPAPTKVIESCCINETLAVDHIQCQLVEEKTMTSTLRRQLMYLRKELGKSRADLLREQQLRKRADEWTEYLEAELESYVKSRADAEKRYLSMLQVVKGIDRFTKRLLHKYVSLHRKLENAYDRQGFEVHDVPSIPGLRNPTKNLPLPETDDDETEPSMTSLSLGTVNMAKRSNRKSNHEAAAGAAAATSQIRPCTLPSPGSLASCPLHRGDPVDEEGDDFVTKYLSEHSSLRKVDVVGVDLFSDDPDEYEHTNWSSNNLQLRANASRSSNSSTAGGESKHSEAPTTAFSSDLSTGEDQDSEGPRRHLSWTEGDGQLTFDGGDNCLQELTHLLSYVVHLSEVKLQGSQRSKTPCETASNDQHRGENGAHRTESGTSSMVVNVEIEEDQNSCCHCQFEAESEASSELQHELKHAENLSTTKTKKKKKKRQSSRKNEDKESMTSAADTEQNGYESCEGSFTDQVSTGENTLELGKDEEQKAEKVRVATVDDHRRYVNRLLREMCFYCDRYRPGDRASGLKSMLRDAIEKQFSLRVIKPIHPCAASRVSSAKNN